MFCSLFLILFSFGVFGGDGEFYSMLGSSDNNFVLSGYNLFGDSDTDVQDYIFGAENINLFPLVYDLDGNGYKEIIVFSGQSILLLNYSGDDLNYLNSFTLPSHTADTINGYYSNPVVLDVDSNGFPDLIFVDEYLQNIYFLEYNGTHFFNSSMINLGLVIYDSAIGCSGSVCFLVYDGGSGYAVGFNKSQISPNGAINFLGADNCMPDKQGVVIGNGKYYFVGTNAQGEARIQSYELNGSMFPVNFDTITITEPDTIVGSDCGRGDDDFTGLTIGEFDLVITGYELGLAYMTSSNTFEISIFDKDLNRIDQSPFIDASGVFLSNVFMARVTNEGVNNYNSMCIMGGKNHYTSFGSIKSCVSNIVCVVDNSVDTLGLTYDNLEFQYIESDSSPLCYNLSNSFVYNNLIHSVNSDLNSVSSEALTTFGIFDLSAYLDSDCFFGVCPMDLIYTNPKMSSSYPIGFILADVESNNRLDIVGVSNNSVFYLDDGFTNQLPFLNNESSYIRPDYRLNWELGTKIKVVAQVTDLDNPTDKCRVKAYLYYNDNDSLVESNWTDFKNSDSLHTITFLNVSPLVEDALLRILVSDIKHNDSYRAYNYYYDVVLNGSTYEDNERGVIGEGEEIYTETEDEGEDEGGDCVVSSDCSGDLVCVDSSCEELPNTEDNAIKDGLNEISYLANVPLIVLILIIFGIIIFSVFKEPRIPNQIKLPVILLLSLFGFGISIYLGILSVLWLILLVILIIIVLAVFIIRFVGR